MDKKLLYSNAILLNINRLKTKFYRFLRIIKESISGEDRDYTTVKLSKAIFLLSIPMVLEMIMESVFAIVDIFFVSKLGADAVATVGLTESIITIVYAIGFGLSMATTAMVSRRIGEKDAEKAANVAFQAIITGLIISLFIAIPGIIFAKDILEFMGANSTIVNNMSGFTSIMLGGNTVIMLLFIINAVFRSSGDAAISMRVLWLGNIINIILDPLLIFGLGPFPELNIKGAAIATTIGRGIAVCYQFYLLYSNKFRIKLSKKNFYIDIKTIYQILKLAIGGIGQNIIATSSWIGLMRIMSVFGSVVLAGYTIAIRIIIFALLPSFGISNAAATMVGQNLGADKPDRAEKSVWYAGRINVVLMGIISIIFIIFPEFFISIFIKQPDVIAIGVEGLRIVSIGFIFYGLGMVLINSINGAGDTLTPIKLNIVFFWLIEIPVAYLLSFKCGINEKGVFYAIIIAESMLTLTALLYFKKGKWKSIKI